jgi:hypothetical protein
MAQPVAEAEMVVDEQDLAVVEQVVYGMHLSVPR